MALFAREDHETISWSLTEFSICKDFKWSKPEEENDRTEFASGNDDYISATTYAHGFVSALEVLAGAAQNKTFRVHTVIAKGIDKNDDFDMVARGYTECVVEPWMSQPTSSSPWSK
ncbi:hypothetical protein N0V86_001297 [Didymella sp. IMI 355093]|nr:hypothetical protein N0V86_001297 [Didymella sp. IMI 355093]